MAARRRAHDSLEVLRRQRASALRALRTSPGWRGSSGEEREEQVKVVQENFRSLERAVATEERAQERSCGNRSETVSSVLRGRPTIEINLRGDE